MCGIVGAVAERNIVPVLIEGLKRLEYRGYDSAGLAIFDQSTKQLKRCRRVGKVNELQKALDHDSSFISRIGIAHTRWATHGIPSELNAHPHFSHNEIAVVHNGIIENHDELRRMLQTKGYIFESETDTEVIAHLLHFCSKQTDYLVDAVKLAIKQLEGAYGLASVNVKQPDRLVVARSGSPLVIGLGLGENFIASDQLALRQVTDRFIYLEEGDIAEIEQKKINIWDKNNQLVTRGIVQSTEKIESINKGKYRHFMLKEIYEQPEAIKKTLENRLGLNQVLINSFGPQAESVFKQIENIQIVACGTSYHAGMVARYWFESLANIPCQVEVASEFRSRKVATQKNTLFVSISQSGETADTLAALRDIKNKPYLASLAICNVGTSSLVRESDLTLLTLAGPEIGVASTKAFTTQLVSLMLLTLCFCQTRNTLAQQEQQELVKALHQLPDILSQALGMSSEIETLSEHFADKDNTLFLGRGSQYPVAMEGALKLKEISYIHAEAYPAGELKHGPLALIDDNMPVVTIAPNNELLEKLKSNLHEVKARGGELIVFADKQAKMESTKGIYVIHMPHIHDALTPILYTIPLQLLSYYVALVKGTDVDQPRNLAKSVTVE